MVSGALSCSLRGQLGHHIFAAVGPLFMMPRLDHSRLLWLLLFLFFLSMSTSTSVETDMVASMIQRIEDWEDAADEDDSGAMFNLGLAFDLGKGVIQDDEAAFKWYKKAAKKGNAQAQVNLGAMYLKGRGCTEDEAAAVSWIEKGAAQGNGAGQIMIGQFYERGEGGYEKDNTMATRYYDLAVDQGYSEARRLRDRAVEE